MTNEEESMTMSSDISFIELCTNLLNALPGPMAKDFSAQIAFVGLLHLANEKVAIQNFQQDLEMLFFIDFF